ncbi:hypothetical protein RND81_02G086600 [Saponaria officinalis]|uniref:RNA helicase n=1 Tax=Saponaria officinalis TaxID=3572 RepID=A0AAW1MNK8_SAPOF
MASQNREFNKPNPSSSSSPFLVSSKADLKRREDRKKKAKSGGFESLNLCPNVFRAIKRKGYQVPTPIQRKTMPIILAGADVVAMARTGSGKTAAFLIPMLQKLNQHVSQCGVRALILSPTRDLALQTLKFTKELGRFTDLRTSLLVGGESMESQFEELAQNPDIIIATPGRLMHHLAEVDDMSLRSVEYVVFDEADSLFEMGFAEQLHQILSQLSENRQTLLFSATLPSALADFAKADLRDPHLIRLDVDTRIDPNLTMTFFTLRQEEKYAALLYLIREVIKSDDQTMIFVATSLQAEFVKLLFQLEGIESSICYGKMDQDARKINVSKFRSRKTMILIVTDLGARGLDIPLLDNVINWDYPPKPKMFVHRVGRVARAGRTGTAYSLVTSEDMAYVLDLHLFLSKPIRAAPTEEEVLNDMDGVMAKIDQAIADKETIYGRFPQTALDLVQDKIRQVIHSSADLTALQKASANAFRQYIMTKPMPSKQSIRRVKDLPREGLHPMFKDAVGANELTALAFSERLKLYRPKQTVLEAEGAAAKSKNRHGASRQWIDVMKRKRSVHEQIIKKVHQQRSSEKATEQPSSDDEPHKCSIVNDIKEVRLEIESFTRKDEKETNSNKRKERSFRDEEYYISPVPVNQHLEAGLSVRSDQGFGSNRFESAVMDLIADDNAGIQKQRSIYHWDKKGKKYIKLNNGKRVTASGKVKTEGGQRVKAQKTGIYSKWKAKTHNKITSRGTDNESDIQLTAASQGGGRFNRRFHRGTPQREIPNAHLPSEIKDVEQVRKQRQRKAIQQSYVKNKTSKGKGNNHGKNGKKRKSK